MKAGVEPARRAATCRALRAVGSTGSPLSPEGFALGLRARSARDTWLFSTSGGTDVCTAFVGGVPDAAGLRGRAAGARARRRGRGLGRGRASRSIGEVGELVITEPMPSMPVFFWDDPDGERYREAYFDDVPRRLAPRRLDRDHRRAARRSSTAARDSTINRGGVRMGTSEIYRAVLALDEVVDALVVDVPREGERELDAAVRRAARRAPSSTTSSSRAIARADPRGLLAAPRARTRSIADRRGAAHAVRQGPRGAGQADPHGRRPRPGGEPRVAGEPGGARLVRRAGPPVGSSHGRHRARLRRRGAPGPPGRRRHGVLARARGRGPGPHRPPEPGAQRVPRRLRRERADPGRPGRRPAVRRRGRRRPAAGRARGDQGRRRRRGRRHDLGHRGPRAAGPAGQPRGGPAAGRRRDRRRPHERARAHAVAVHRDADLRRDPQPVGPRPHAGRLERRVGRRGRGRPVRGRRRAATAPARSGSRPRSAGCSGSSRPAAASRSGRPTPTPGTGSPSSARWPAPWPTPPCSSTSPPTACRPAASAAAVAAGPGRLRVGGEHRPRARDAGPPRGRRSAARWRRPPTCCARSATRCEDVDVDYGPRGVPQPADAVRAGHPRRRRLPAAPGAPRAPHAGDGAARRAGVAAGGGAGAPRRGRAGRAHRPGLRPRRRAPAARARGPALPHRGAARPGSALDRQRRGRQGAVVRRLERRRAPRGLGPGRVRPPRPARWPSSSSAPTTPRRACWRSAASSRPRARGPTAGRPSDDDAQPPRGPRDRGRGRAGRGRGAAGALRRAGRGRGPHEVDGDRPGQRGGPRRRGAPSAR